MAHLPSGPRLYLSVKVNFRVRYRGCGQPIRFAIVPKVAQQIRHRRRNKLLDRSERKSAHCTKLLFELTGEVRVKGEVPRIVRPRRKLVDEQRVVLTNEELDA